MSKARLARAFVVMGSWSEFGRPSVTLEGMEPHRLADRLQRTTDHLVQVTSQINPDDPDPNAVNIALAEAKRGRRELTLLVRALGALRDKLQP